MKHTISRKGTRLTALFYWLSVACILLGFLWLAEFLLAAIPLMAVSVVLQIYHQRCPRCGTFFRGIYWSKTDAGYCRGCGERLIFDD